MTPDILHANFPDDVPLPDTLVRLCAYTEAAGTNSLGGDLNLSATGRRSLEAGSPDVPGLADHFIVFAADGSGAMYGYWRYEQQPLDRVPLVYLDDEGVDNRVLANTIEELLTLIALGQPYLGVVDKWDEDEQPDPYTTRYRVWLRAELQIEAPTVAQARVIVERATAAHPDINAWLERLLGIED